MSRRKQAKPQHLKSVEEEQIAGLISETARGEVLEDADSGNESRSGSEETHVCEKCCAEFFKWCDFCEHLQSCTKNPLVLIVNDDEGAPADADVPSLLHYAGAAEEDLLLHNPLLLPPTAPPHLPMSALPPPPCSPAPSCCPSEQADSEEPAEGGRSPPTEAEDALEVSGGPEREDEPMELELSPGKPLDAEEGREEASPEAPDNDDSSGGDGEGSLPPLCEAGLAPVAGYAMPSTNVTLETLHGTRVAVAQFSQSVREAAAAAVGGVSSSLAIPVILDQLVALQQQQIHQLQLIEQIRSQVALMNRQPGSQPQPLNLHGLRAAGGTSTGGTSARNPELSGNPCSSTSLPAQLQLHGFIVPPVHQLPIRLPATLSGPTAGSLSSAVEGSLSHHHHHHHHNHHHHQSAQSGTALPSSCSAASHSSPSSSAVFSAPVGVGLASLMTSCSSMATDGSGASLVTGVSVSGGVSTLPRSTSGSSSSPPLLHHGHGSLLGSTSASNLPLIPHSSSSTVIFPNPLASIAATANALDPLSALMKHRKGKPPNVSVFDAKPSSEDPFFKHKCRFCAKVFGSDSALQIHLRSHTGERPFKCNICGNRFSTKGNLKVHFQRHKEKYPHIQMNPYPVPEYLDNVPTSSGIPYGMSLPPEKPVTTWLDSKPVLPTIPTSASLQLPPTLPSMMGVFGESPSLTPLSRSPQRPSPPSSECASLSPNVVTDSGLAAATSPPPPSRPGLLGGDVLPLVKPEGVHLPPNCTTTTTTDSVTQVVFATTVASTSPGGTQITETSAATTPVSHPVLPMLSDQFKAKFPFGGLLDSMQTSETSKLQQLVENIDKKMTDPNQCVICHRVLSCQSALKMHYRIHTGERPFKCKICGRAFTTKGNLKTHFGVHRSKPPLRVQHSCPICQKKFTNAVVLQQHIRMHMGGQIPNTPLPESLRETDADLSYDEKSMDAMSGYDDDDDDDLLDEMEQAMEDEEDLKEAEMDPCKPYSPGSPPPSSVISSIAALENQMKMIDSTVNMSHSFGHKPGQNGGGGSSGGGGGFGADGDFFFASDSLSSAVGDLECRSLGSPALSESSSGSMQHLSPAHSHSENHKSPVGININNININNININSNSINNVNNINNINNINSNSINNVNNSDGVLLMEDAPVNNSAGAIVKSEKSETPSPLPAGPEGSGALDLTAPQLSRPPHYIKEESPFNMLFLSRDRGLSGPSLASTASNMIKMEMNGHGRPLSLGDVPPHLQAVPASAPPRSASSAGVSPGSAPMAHGPMLAPPPPRRTPKQHNCHSCGKNFSSASALQIHERTHTGEKPFGCSICGRAFTTKGNLKVHMGTHMWNNAPARRGRRLSVENPMALLGGDALKFGEMFQKDLAARAMNADPGFWSQYAAAITGGLAMKNNEISVIQNGGLTAQLPLGLACPGSSGVPALAPPPSMERMRAGGVGRASPPMTVMEKAGMEGGAGRPFSRFMEENKEIGIN